MVLGTTNFVEPCTKVYGQYYQEVSLTKYFFQILFRCQNFTCFDKTLPRLQGTRDSWSVDNGDSWLNSPTLWPPNSPDSNPMDYKVWSVMQEVYKGRIKNVDELHSRILTAWDELDQDVIDVATAVMLWFPAHASVLKPKANTLNTYWTNSL